MPQQPPETQGASSQPRLCEVLTRGAGGSPLGSKGSCMLAGPWEKLQSLGQVQGGACRLPRQAPGTMAAPRAWRELSCPEVVEKAEERLGPQTPTCLPSPAPPLLKSHGDPAETQAPCWGHPLYPRSGTDGSGERPAQDEELGTCPQGSWGHCPGGSQQAPLTLGVGVGVPGSKAL